MTERKNAFRAVVDALIEARDTQATRQVKKYMADRADQRVPFRIL